MDLPTTGDELHHFGWNTRSSALMQAGHDMGAEGLQRRYLVMPGLRSSNVHDRIDARGPRVDRVNVAAFSSDRSIWPMLTRPTGQDRPAGAFLWKAPAVTCAALLRITG
jgi:selenium-binding protein 1